MEVQRSYSGEVSLIGPGSSSACHDPEEEGYSFIIFYGIHEYAAIANVVCSLMPFVIRR